MGLWLERGQGPSWQGIIVAGSRQGCGNKKLRALVSTTNTRQREQLEMVGA